MKKVYVSEYINNQIYDYLSQRFEIISSKERLAEVDAMVTRNFIVDKPMLDMAENLKVIGVFGTGTNRIDMVEAKRRNIDVFTAPGQNAYSVAELVISLMLDIAKRVTTCDRYIRQGKIQANAPHSLLGVDIRGKTLGIIGTGNIARHTAKIAKLGFDMRVIGYSKHFTKEKAEGGNIEFAPSIEAVMSQSDYVSISIPLNEETEGIINRERLGLMKPTACLINTSRGKVVDEAALYELLRDKKIAAAACDVFSVEPPRQDNPLFTLDNFVGTPHIGDNTDEACYRVGKVIAEGLVERLIDK